MKKSVIFLMAGFFILSFTGLVRADFVGNKSSKFYFPENCSYVKLIKKDNQVMFKTSAEAETAGYKASSKCKADEAGAAFIGNKSSKLFFPADCSYAKMVKDDNKVSFKSSAEAMAAGYKASSKCGK